MNYCENCSAAFESERCPACGTKKVRQARDDDFCFLIENDMLRCDVITGVLETNDIQYTSVPSGSGVESYFGKPLCNCRVYVPFGSLEKARNILRDLEKERTEELRAQLLDNVKLFNAPPKTEKKARKKFKLPKETDFIAFCADNVKSADRITDETAIGMQWRYVFCYSDGWSITFNSKTFEILAARKTEA